jgi:ABC-type uncharacterized transport system permease subunit
MDRTTRIPKDFVVVMQALVIICVATPGILNAIQKGLSASLKRKKRHG